MLYKLYNWIILLLLLNPFMMFSMNSMYSLWMNMELNMIIFLIYLIMNNENNKIIDLPMKYFIINSFSSIFFFLMINMFIHYNLNMMIYMIDMFMFIKMGMFPFHHWFINMMMMIDWMSCFFLSIWQKLIPLLVVFYMNLNIILFFFIIMNGLLSVIMSINEMNLKKIMGFSSINHLCWMLLSLIYSMNLFIMYYYIYFFMNLLLIKIFKNYNYEYLMDFINFLNMKNFKFMNILVILSFGGLPPFLGFLMKFLVILEMLNNFMYMFIMILIIFSLIYLYYYLRLINNFMMKNYYMIKFIYKIMMMNKLNLNYIFLIFMMIFMFFFLLIWLIY